MTKSSMFIPSVFLLITCCTKVRKREVEKVNQYDIVAAIYKQGKFVPDTLNQEKYRSACILGITNLRFDSIYIFENTLINDSIPGIDPQTFISFDIRDTNKIISTEYLYNRAFHKRRIVKDQSMELLLFNAKFFKGDSIDHHNEYLFYTFEKGVPGYLILKVRSSDLSWQVHELQHYE